jgi:hypothetical protein
MPDEIDIQEISGCTCLRLRRAARQMTQIYDGALEPAGITVNQFGLLAKLHEALNLFVEVEHLKLAAAAFDRFIGLDQRANAGAVEMADVLEIQEHSRLTFLEQVVKHLLKRTRLAMRDRSTDVDYGDSAGLASGDPKAHDVPLGISAKRLELEAKQVNI